MRETRIKMPKETRKQVFQRGKQINLPPIAEVEEKVRKAVFGQDEAIRRILTALYRTKIFKQDRGSLLIIGKSGTGKTEILKQIIQNINLPYIIEDATKYTKEGYAGGNVQDMLYHLLQKADGNIEFAQKGVIIVDEIDKKASPQNVENAEADISGVEVIKSLLKLMEGTKIPVGRGYDVEGRPIEEEWDTSGITFIFIGAFTEIESIIKSRTRASLGFLDLPVNKLQENKVLKEDLVQYGLINEFVGRISTIIQLKDLTKEDLVNILKSSNLSPIRKYFDELSRMGISIKMNKKLYTEIAEVAQHINTGARELSAVVDEIMEPILYEILCSPKKYTTCILKEGLVKNRLNYEIF